ncbi:MAG: hypothetical protein R3F13_15070 [Prosthecobacter sp.]
MAMTLRVNDASCLRESRMKKTPSRAKEQNSEQDEREDNAKQQTKEAAHG